MDSRAPEAFSNGSNFFSRPIPHNNVALIYTACVTHSRRDKITNGNALNLFWGKMLGLSSFFVPISRTYELLQGRKGRGAWRPISLLIIDF
jgi:hypothetical protein